MPRVPVPMSCLDLLRLRSWEDYEYMMPVKLRRSIMLLTPKQIEAHIVPKNNYDQLHARLHKYYDSLKSAASSFSSAESLDLAGDDKCVVGLKKMATAMDWATPSATRYHRADDVLVYEGSGLRFRTSTKMVVITAMFIAPPTCWAALKMADATPIFWAGTEVMIPTLKQI